MLKFRGKEEWVVPMGEMMAECLWETGWKAQGITFVPLHPDRLTERGFNQAERLASVIADRTGLPLLPVLERTRHTPSQSRRGRMERLAAMKEAFRVSPFINRQGLPRSWILVDDVYTTGATLVDCARALTDTGDCRVRSLTFAR
ncbi:ComF family protein [Desmospora profundinema]|uniref:Amidophosphoribosyltransferase n=1 Tax=Desmospora profundinema TaxID=1571184 RepID=A0ABU1ILB6_9BACL|nr:hypothetical protein [Desmospora profundinema]MDR6225566.1 putative amidophosphoribosyltransferase [Desmospora profundinema]